MENKILADIASYIAMTLVVFSYFTRKKERFLLFQSLCIVFLIVSYFFNLQFFAMVGLAVGLLRALVYFAYEKRGRLAPMYWPFLLSGLTLASYLVVNFAILETADPLDILCLVGLVLCTIEDNHIIFIVVKESITVTVSCQVNLFTNIAKYFRKTVCIR